MLHITAEQRTAILRAACDARKRGPVALVDGQMSYDAISLASDTNNYWWQGGMDNVACACALRLIHMSLRLGPRRTKVIARFAPEAWINDQTIEVDLEGPAEWDATAAFHALDTAYRDRVLAEMHDQTEALDRDDRLKNDPASPPWVRDWNGPFRLYLRLGGEQ